MGRLQLAESPIGKINVSDYYINVPTPDGRIVKIREDKFDDLSPEDWHNTMDYLEQFNTQPSVNGLFSKWRENRAERKDARVQRKTDAKTQKITARAEGRALVAKEGGGIGGALKNIGGVVGSIFGGKTDDMTQGGAPTQRDLTIGYSSETPKWYQNPTVIIGGVAVLGLGAYLLSRSKNKK